jgi:hypothetical protein
MIRSVFWRPLDEIGLEHLLLSVLPDRIEADGLILQTKAGRGPFRARYRIEAAPDWTMRRCEIRVEEPCQGERRLDLHIDGDGRWRDEAARKALPELDGCRDVDIQISPFTNSLPIGRLTLAQGRSAEIRAAYITVPELTLAPAPQRYTRLGPDRYRYEGLGTGFAAEIAIDAEGLVLDYPGVFQRVERPDAGTVAKPFPRPSRAALILSAFRLSFEARLRRAPQDEAKGSRRTRPPQGEETPGKPPHPEVRAKRASKERRFRNDPDAG